MKNIILLLCVSTTALIGQQFKPETVGMSASRLTWIDSVINHQMKNKWLPGAVAMVARNGKLIYSKTWGSNGINNGAMKNDDVFRLASMTKPIVSTGIMILVEEGKILLDEKLSKYIPEFKNTKKIKDLNVTDSTYTTELLKTEPTVRHLLTHTSGIGYSFTNPKVSGIIYGKSKIPDGANIDALKLADKMKALASLPLLHEPGEKWTYGLSTDMAGYLIEVVSGQSLSDFIETRILIPLKMKDTHFFFDEKYETRLVHLYTEFNGTVVDAMQFPQAKNAWFPVKGAKTYFSGGSGLSGTAADYMRFMQMILNNGTLDGVRILGRKSIEAMSNNQIGTLSIDEKGTKFGIGFSVQTNESAYRKLGSPGRLGWSGLYDTVFWIDPKEKLCAVLLTQVYPSNHVRELHDTFENAVYQSLVD